MDHPEDDSPFCNFSPVGRTPTTGFRGFDIDLNEEPVDDDIVFFSSATENARKDHSFPPDTEESPSQNRILGEKNGLSASSDPSSSTKFEENPQAGDNDLVFRSCSQASGSGDGGDELDATPSNWKPYDPVNNCLVPRPQFLRYDPYRCHEILRRMERERQGEDKEGSSISLNNWVQKSGQPSDQDGSRTASSSSASVRKDSIATTSRSGSRSMENAEREEVSDGGGGIEEEGRPSWFTMLWKILILFATLFFSSYYLVFGSSSGRPSHAQDFRHRNETCQSSRATVPQHAARLRTYSIKSWETVLEFSYEEGEEVGMYSKFPYEAPGVLEPLNHFQIGVETDGSDSQHGENLDTEQSMSSEKTKGFGKKFNGPKEWASEVEKSEGDSEDVEQRVDYAQLEQEMAVSDHFIISVEDKKSKEEVQLGSGINAFQLILSSPNEFLNHSNADVMSGKGESHWLSPNIVLSVSVVLAGVVSGVLGRLCTGERKVPGIIVTRPPRVDLLGEFPVVKEVFASERMDFDKEKKVVLKEDADRSLLYQWSLPLDDDLPSPKTVVSPSDFSAAGSTSHGGSRAKKKVLRKKVFLDQGRDTNSPSATSPLRRSSRIRNKATSP